MWPAIRATFSRTRRAARTSAPPLTTMLRLANEPLPYGQRSVSPSTMLTAPMSTPSSSARTWASVVACPCPCDAALTNPRTSPVGSTRTVAASWPATCGIPRRRNVPDPIPVNSVYAHTPIPRRRPGAARRLGAEPLVVRGRERSLERVGGVAAVDHEPRRGGERQRAGVDEVPPPHLGGVEAGAPRHHVDHALAHERAERHADAAVRAGRALVGGHGVGVVGQRREAVRTGQDPRRGERLERRRHRVDGVRAGVADQRAPERADDPVAAGGHLGVVHVVAGLGAGEEVLAPVLEPAHGSAEPARDLGHRDVLGIEVHLRSEPAADRRAEDAQLRVRDAEGLGQPRAHQVRRLGRGPHGEHPVHRIERRHHAARLHRRGRAARVAERLGDADRRRLEARLDGAVLEARVEDDVVAQLLEEPRRARLHARPRRRQRQAARRTRRRSRRARPRRGTDRRPPPRRPPRRRSAPCRGPAPATPPPCRPGWSSPPRTGRVVTARSAPVNTASTPGSARARLASIRVIRAWACGLLRNATERRPGSRRSPMKRARPMRSGGSSVRFTLALT